MIGGLRRYIEQGIGPGHFLSALLSNNLRASVERADDINRRAIVDYVKFLYNYAPAGAGGSPEKFEAWIARSDLGMPDVAGEPT
jgi:hypothetical protein